MIESDLKWEFGIIGEEEETFAAKSEDPIMKKIWRDKIPVQAINVDKVFKGTHALINWVNIRLGPKIKSCLIQNQVKPLLPFCIRIRKIPLLWSYSLRKFTARGLKFI